MTVEQARGGTDGAQAVPPATGWVGPALALVAVLTLVRLAFVAWAGLELDFEEAQYWFWSGELAWGYFSKPPLIAWLIHGATALCGDGEACIRFPSPLIHAATAMVAGAIGASLGPPENRRRLALWSAAGYATLPGVSFSAFLMTTDVPLLFFWALALLAWIRLLRGGRRGPGAGAEAGWGWAALGGVALGGDLLAKYAMAYFLLCAALHLLLSAPARRAVAARWPAFLLFLGLGLIIVAPNLAWNAQDGFITFQHTAENVDLGGDPFNPGRMLEFIGSQFGVFGPILFAVLIAALPFWRRLPGDAHDDARVALGAFCYPIIVLLVVQALLSRANANWAAAAYVAGTVYVAHVLLVWRRARLLKLSLGLHLALALGLYLALATIPAVAIPGLGAKPVAARLHGWAALGDRVAAQLAAERGSILLSEYRRVLNILIYYARVPDGGFAKWNPEHDTDDQYELSGRVVERAASDNPAARFVVVSERPDPVGIANRFESWRLLEVVEVPLGAGLTRRHWLYEARGFRGY
jgi:4-amino-4-deoxy-L-arabinose transferase-like glycosyltransferase